MLKTLNIENIAVIESAKIEFNKGLNVLTGETGAGKSIVVDSINAILGERTSKELVRHGADYAFVSAFFVDISQDVCTLLDEYGIEGEEDGSLLLTRKISKDGKSTCKINGKSATVSMLREIGRILVNIHGQHDSQALLNPDYHYKYIDMLAQSSELLSEYKQAFSHLLSIRRRLKALTVDEDEKDRRLELLDYQIKELENADIKIGETAGLLEKKKAMENCEAMLRAYSALISCINGNDNENGALTALTDANREIEAFSHISKNAEKASSVMNNVFDELETVKDIIEAEISSLDFSENEREQTEERLDFLFRLSKKYGETEEEMLSYLEKAKEERKAVLFDEQSLEELNDEYDNAYSQVLSLADEISKIRKDTAVKFEKEVKERLEYLDMPKIRFIVNFEKGILTSNGYDKIEFLISTNPGEPPKPLSKIASGGELSRIMLAIKNLIAYNDTVGTLIFDEIDTGVSGRASRKIGLALKSVSKSTQVITVTHSAQIASAADYHFLIQKDFENDRTYTKVTLLDYNGRINELARIMGGIKITPVLLQSAEELLKNIDN